MTNQDTSLGDKPDELDEILESVAFVFVTTNDDQEYQAKKIVQITETEIADDIKKAKQAFLAWHSTQQKALLKRVREIVDGNEIDVEATREHMEKLGASEHEILNMEIEADDVKDTLDGVRKAIDNLMEELR